MKQICIITNTHPGPKYKAFRIRADNTGEFTGICGEDLDEVIHDVEYLHPDAQIELDSQAQQAQGKQP